MTFEILASILAGIALAAAAGFRAFLPLLVVSIASRFGWIEIHPGLEFLATDIALIGLAVATLLEIGADKIPVVDHLLDLVSGVLRPVAGVVAGMAPLTDLPQPAAVALALVLATISFGTQVGKAKVRLGSTASTAGFGNPILSMIEDGISFVLSLLAVLVPIVAGILVLLVLFFLYKLVRRVQRAAARVFRGRPPRSPAPLP